MSIAAIAGVNISSFEYDYGVDTAFRSIIVYNGRRVTSGIQVDCQLKSTVDWEIKNNLVIYDLEVKNYNDLVIRYNTTPDIPLYLILLCLPREKENWFHLSINELILKKCCYWYRVSCEDKYSDNKNTVTVKIPLSNILEPATIISMLSEANLKR